MDDSTCLSESRFTRVIQTFTKGSRGLARPRLGWAARPRLGWAADCVLEVVDAHIPIASPSQDRLCLKSHIKREVIMMIRNTTDIKK